MVIYLAIILVICLFRVRFSTFHDTYIDTTQATANKGICAALILLSHMGQALPAPSSLDISGQIVLGHIGQLMVVPFFFYSGYGIHRSLLRSKTYLNGFLKNRILKTLIRFDIAVLAYVILNICLGIPYEAKNYLLCWIAWEDLGNSSWFVFAILVMYLFTYFSFKICKNAASMKPILLVGGLTVVYCVLIRFTKGSSWWYDTILCYPFGMLYSLYKNRFEAILKKYSAAVLIALVGTVLFLGYLKIKVTYYFFLPMAVASCFLMVVANTKISVQNKLLLWLGEHSFAIYILQRIPMAVLSHFSLTDNSFVFSVISIGSTLLLALVFDKAVNGLFQTVLFKTKTIDKTNAEKVI